jgi:hypothetical protein
VSIKASIKAVPLVALLGSSPLLAQDTGSVHPWLEDDFVISLGAFWQREQFKIRVDGQVPGEEIDFNEATDLSDSHTTGSGWLRWRFGEKWSVTGQYWASDNSARAVLKEDVTWGDSVLKAGSNVGAGTELDLVRVFLGRELFTKAPNHEFGLGAGLHWMQIDAFIDGEFIVDDQSSGFRRESVTADIPLPNIGAWYWRSLSPRWLLTSHVDWFSASFSDYSGSLYDAGVGLHFQAWEHVGFGLSYQYFKIDVDVDKTDWRGSVELIQNGPFLAVDFNW